MFGMSLTKILVTLAVALVVWGLYRILVRRRAIPALSLRTRLRAAWREAIRPAVGSGSVTLTRCPTCGDHVSAACSRPACPMAT